MDVSQLKRIPLFSDASDEELRRVAVFAESKEIPEGEVVIEEGGYSRELLAIEDGKAEVTRDGEKIADLGPGTAKSRLKLSSLRHCEVKWLKKDAPDVYRRIEQLVEERSG